MTILVTGTAGFIGMHTAKRLLENNIEVFGIDNLNDYYDPKLKNDRLKVLKQFEKFTFAKVDIADQQSIIHLFKQNSFETVIHLAAQAGVRYSIKRPETYIHSNLLGFANILEACRHASVKHLIYASSSSVYGLNSKMPFSTSDGTNHPVSLYAATKKANELMAHSYSHLFGLPTTGLRFFTVYGPWGRPDMAYYKFTKNIIEEKPIQVFNKGNMKRDFTYIDDIVEGITELISHVPHYSETWDRFRADPSSSSAPFRIYNIGNNKPVELIHFIQTIEKIAGKKAILDMQPMQPGDVTETYADIGSLQNLIGFEPTTSIEEGLRKFVEWYQFYHQMESIK